MTYAAQAIEAIRTALVRNEAIAYRIARTERIAPPRTHFPPNTSTKAVSS